MAWAHAGPCKTQPHPCHWARACDLVGSAHLTVTALANSLSELLAISFFFLRENDPFFILSRHQPLERNTGARNALLTPHRQATFVGQPPEPACKRKIAAFSGGDSHLYRRFIPSREAPSPSISYLTDADELKPWPIHRRRIPPQAAPTRPRA